MNKIKILALFGKSGAGKDTIQQWIINNLPQTKAIISCTTRPPRDNEINTLDYYFIGNAEFASKVLDGSMLEATNFNGWYYGTAFDELNPNFINVGVFNITGIECLLEDPRLEVLPCLILTDDKTRLYRVLGREENPNCIEICRRFLADEEDFRHIDFEYVFYHNKDSQNIDKILSNATLQQFLGIGQN